MDGGTVFKGGLTLMDIGYDDGKRFFLCREVAEVNDWKCAVATATGVEQHLVEVGFALSAMGFDMPPTLMLVMR